MKKIKDITANDLIKLVNELHWKKTDFNKDVDYSLSRKVGDTYSSHRNSDNIPLGKCSVTFYGEKDTFITQFTFPINDDMSLTVYFYPNRVNEKEDSSNFSSSLYLNNSKGFTRVKDIKRGKINLYKTIWAKVESEYKKKKKRESARDLAEQRKKNIDLHNTYVAI